MSIACVPDFVVLGTMCPGMFEILLLGEEHGHMAGDAVLIAEIDAVCDRTRHEAAICQIHLTIVLFDGLEFDLVVEELEVRPGRLFLDIGVLILVGHSKTPFISHVLDYIIGKHQFMDRDSKLVLDVMPDVFPKCPDIQLLLSRCVCIEKSRENIKTLVFVLKVIDDVFSFLFRVLELLRND